VHPKISHLRLYIYATKTKETPEYCGVLENEKLTLTKKKGMTRFFMKRHLKMLHFVP